MSIAISTSYFDYHSHVKQFYAVDNLTIIALTVPPKDPDLDYCKKLVYDVFEFFGIDKYIQSLIWEGDLDSSLVYNWMPIVNFKFIFDDELHKKCRAIYNDLCYIVSSAWYKNY
jgi:hypothetical protein